MGKDWHKVAGMNILAVPPESRNAEFAFSAKHAIALIASDR